MATIDRRGLSIEDPPPASDSIQIVTTASATIDDDTTLVIIERAGPTLTLLTLPALADHGNPQLRILDWSTSITDHEIRLTPDGTETIMKAATFSLFSNATQLASATFYPSTALNGWYIGNNPTFSGLTITTSTFNGNIWTAGTGTLTLGAGKTATVSNTLTFTGTDGSTAAFGAGGTVAYKGTDLSQFAATTSLQLKGVISDETGSGALVFATSPSLVTPLLGTPTSGALTNCTVLPLSGLTTQAAFTFVGNNTSGAAVPTAVDIAALTTKASPAAGDYVILSDQAASGAWKKATVSTIGGGGGGVTTLNNQTGALTLVSLPQTRLSLTSAVAITTSDVTAATTVYLMAGSCPVSDGTNIVPNTSAQLSILLDTTNHLSGKNFDLFKINDAGTMRIGTGPTWNAGAVAGSDTARGTGAGSTDISQIGNTGIYVNTNSITIRYSSVATVAVAASQAVYLGSIRTSANGQTEDSVLNRFLFNAYNIAERKLLRLYSGNPDNYSTAAWAQAHASALNKVNVLLGLTGSLVTIDVLDIVANSTTTARVVHCGIGIDSTTVNSADLTGYGTCTTTIVPSLSAHYRGNPGLGLHAFNGLEYGTGTDTQSWYATAGVSQAGIRGSLWA